jgi:uncharacterized membrane protein
VLAQGVTFNTTMALVAGAVPLLLLIFGRVLARPDRPTIVGWSWMIGALGLYLFVTGTYMTLTWPLQDVPAASHCCAVDNITFGEPAMYFGALLLFGAFALLRAERASLDHGTPLDVVAVVRPFLYAGAFGGLGLFMIAVSGLQFGMWRPPPDEPIAGLLAGTGLEPIYIACAYAVTGLAAVTAPFAPERRLIARIAAVSLFLAGMLWLFVALTVFYGHIGFTDVHP